MITVSVMLKSGHQMEEWSVVPFISYGGVDVAKMYTAMYQACPGPGTFLLSKYKHMALGCKVTNF